MNVPVQEWVNGVWIESCDISRPVWLWRYRVVYKKKGWEETKTIRGISFWRDDAHLAARRIALDLVNVREDGWEPVR